MAAARLFLDGPIDPKILIVIVLVILIFRAVAIAKTMTIRKDSRTRNRLDYLNDSGVRQEPHLKFPSSDLTRRRSQAMVIAFSPVD